MEKNPQLLEALNKAIAAELTAITQYMWHYVMVSGMQAESVKKAFRNAAMDEMNHAEDIAERLNFLGGVPTIKPNEIKVGGDVQKMIKDDLALEHGAVDLYRKIIALCGDDHTTRRLMEEILMQEEDHIDTWETLLDVKK